MRLFARRTDQSRAVPLGRAVADRRGGGWRLRASRALRDGSYAITATEADRRGHVTGPVPLGPLGPSGALVIDTRAPRITDATFDPDTREVTITYQDRDSGFDVEHLSFGSGPLADPENYRLSKPGTSSEALSLFLSPDIFGSDPEDQPRPNDPVTLSGTIDDPEPKPGDRYWLTVLARGVTDLAGNALDGESRGLFPAGDGRPGGNFRTRLAASPRRAWRPGR
ncbi:MAG TPA: hypothetical protein VF590_00665 [Isosphaeraceae bacterium]